MSFYLPDAQVLRQYQWAPTQGESSQGAPPQEARAVAQGERSHAKNTYSADEVMQKQAHRSFTPHKACSFSLKACLHTRAAALLLQNNFMAWQEMWRQKPPQVALEVETEYATWFQAETHKALQTLPKKEQKNYMAWAGLQNTLYAAWVREFAAEQELAYAMALQEDIIHSAKALIQGNTQSKNFVRQGVEQMVAAVREKALLQALSPSKSQRLLHEEMGAALEELIPPLIQKSEMPSARQIVLEFKPFLCKKQVQKWRKKVHGKTS